MTTRTADFEITGWDEQFAEPEPTEGAALARAVVTKRFTGAIEGTSVTHVLTAVGPGGSGYLAMERVEGVLDGRRGAFVIGHGGLDEEGDLASFGQVVPGSGTGELAGLRGSAHYIHEGETARLTLTFALG